MAHSLTPEQLEDYARIIERQDGTPEWLEARNKFALHYKYLVRKECFNIYTPRIRNHELWEDLQQQGMIGLLEAAGKVTVARYDNFPPYANLFIRKQLVSVWHANQLPVKLTRNRGQLAGKMNRRALDADGRILPLDKVVALFPDETPANVKTVWELLVGASVSLDVYGVDGVTGNAYTQPITHPKLNTPAADDLLLPKLRTDRLNAVLDTLPEQERDIIRYRFGFTTGTPEPYASTCASFGLSIEQVKELEHSGFAKLSHESRRSKLFI